MSIFGLALAGAGQGASEIANKYIDNEIALQRAQAVADIQRTSDVTKAGQMADLAVDPTRRAAARTQSGLDTVATAGATDAAALNTASNEPLTAAKIRQSNTVSAGTLDADTARATALGMAKPEKLTPGEDLVINGKKVATNDKPTMVDAYREGWRTTGREQRDRAFESTLADLNKQEAELTQQMATGMRDGSLTPTMPKAESHVFGADTPGKDPAFDRYQWFQKRLGALQVQRAAAIEAYRSVAGGSGASTVDPLGLRGGKGKGGGASSSSSDATPGTPVAESSMPPIEANGPDDAIKKLQAVADDPTQSESARGAAALNVERVKATADQPPPPAPAGVPFTQRAAAAAPPPPLPKRIEPPPPEFGFNGNARAPNPAYAAWLKRYGGVDPWLSQQRSDDAAAQLEAERARQMIESRRAGPGARGNV